MLEKEILINDIYIPLIEDKSDVLIIKGGAGSGKSVFSHQKIVLRTETEKGHKFLALRKVANTIKDSIFPLFKSIISDFGTLHEYEINKTDKTFTHIPTGNQILCRGLDEPEKIKSIQGVTGVLMEEATEFTHEDFTQLLLRIRGEKENYIQYMMCFNPISENHWIKKELVDKLDILNKGTIKYKYIHTTYQDNYFLTAKDKERLEALKDTNKLYYQIYCLGEWGIEDKSKKFAYSFNEEKHIGKVEFNPNEYTYLSFDFNMNPITCAVIQHYNETIHVVEQIKLNDSNIYKLCDYIQAAYPGAMFIVTGDASGRTSSAMVQDNINYYKVIREKLRLSDAQLKVPTINPSIVENKVLVNAILQNYNVLIDRVKGEGLIYDLRYVEVDENNKLLKDRSSDIRKSDALDCLRYYLNTFHRNYLKIPKL